MDIEDFDLILPDDLGEEFDEGGLSTAGFSHDDDGDLGHHSQVDQSHLHKVVKGHDIVGLMQGVLLTDGDDRVVAE